MAGGRPPARQGDNRGNMHHSVRQVATAVALGAALLARAAQAQGRLIFEHVGVVDLDARVVRPDMTVVVAGGRITRVEPAGAPAGAVADTPAPGPTTVIDGRGRVLIPGLWDTHVHLTKLGPGALAAFLANGVTSVRDMGSDLAEVGRWRREIDAGGRPGPRIKTAGQILETPTHVARMKRGRTVEPVDRLRIAVGTPDEARAAVARLAGGGVDLVKVRSIENVPTLRAIARAARARGLPLAGHPVASPDTLIATGVTDVEHLLTYPPLATAPSARRALYARLRRAGVWMGTTTVNFEGSVLVPYDTAVARLRTDALRRYVSRYLATDWAEQVEETKSPEAVAAAAAYRRQLPRLLRDLREMHAAGVRFLAGSDAAVVFMYPGFSLHGELESLVAQVGLAPADALRAATVNPAAFFGLERELGAVTAGYRADLVLLAGDPLTDVRRTRQIVGVVRDGRWFDRAALDALLERAAAEARR